MRRHRIVIGDTTNPLFDFDNDQLRQVDTVMRNSYSGDELAYDELSAATYAGESWGLISNELYDLYSSEGYQLVSSPADLSAEVPVETPVRYYVDGNLRGKYYALPADRENTLVYDVLAVSAIGLLVNRPHVGGLYNLVPLSTVLAEIINGAFPYGYSEEAGSISVTGWLPYSADARENLHKLLFDYGVMVYKNANGDPYFDLARTTLTGTVDDDDVYVDGTITPIAAATMVRVTEHSYYVLPTDADVTLFDNTTDAQVTSRLVVFEQAPVHDLAVTGSLVIESSGVNYAIVSGNGMLTGKLYTHTTQVHEEGTSGGNVLEFADQTLANQQNSINVAKRLLNYYGATRILSTDFQIQNEKSGDFVTIINPYKEHQNGYIKEMTATGLATIKARCDLLTNFTPTKGGNNYANHQMFTANGTFTVPAGTTMLRIILCQGGEGGSGGYDGLSSNCNDGGDGGYAGPAGRPGKLFIADIPVTPGQSFAVAVGAAGTGGAANVAGTEGGETTFGSYSSANGERPVSGYYDIFEDKYYALAGVDGIAGGKGGKTSSSEYVYGESVTADGQTWTGGRSVPPTSSYDGAGGGGAAYGNNGANAYSAASGGAGADAIDRPGLPTPTLGSGGNGGNGGGGGGKCGAEWSSNLQMWICWGRSARGGNGTAGSDGGAGFALVLY